MASHVAERKTASDYVAQLHAAKRQLAAARRGMARTTTPEGPAFYVDPKWRWAQRLVEARTPALLRYPGVVGVGLGTKVTGRKDTKLPCATIFVRRKQSPRVLKKERARVLPRTIRQGKRRLPTDIVAIGTLARQTSAGQSCSVTTGVTRTGTIGAPAVDTAAGGPVFITAMHVTGHSELPAGSGVVVPVNAPSLRDIPGAPVIGHVLEGSRTGIDAAKVLINPPHVVLPEVPMIGPIRGWRPLTFPGDKGAAVVLFGATSRAPQHGLIVNPSVFMDGFGLDVAITVSGLETRAGDSGAALLDREHLVLGFLVGVAAGGLRVFCPASLVLRRLGCDIPTLS